MMMPSAWRESARKHTILEKSALPTPTITMESGNLEASTILSLVRFMSDITPSCREREGEKERGREKEREGEIERERRVSE